MTMWWLWVPKFAWLVCGFAIVCDLSCGIQADAASTDDCYRKTCGNKTYDIREAVCCGQHLYPGAGLSCCGDQPFHPSAATCCKVRHYNNNITANLTEGLSEEVSACCELEAYNELNKLCCNKNVVTKPAANARCCGEEAIDDVEQLCCGSKNKTLKRNSADHQCCGEDQYNTKTECCCQTSLKKHPINDTRCAPDCGGKTLNSLTELCCDSTVVPKSSPNIQCCDKEGFDDQQKMCCGPIGSRKILDKKTDHQCCGEDQYNTKTECCCQTSLKKHPINDPRCAPGVEQQRAGEISKCSAPQTEICGSSCYNPNEFRCCERKQRSCTTGRCDADPIVYNPCTHVCCEGRLSERKLRQDQFYGSSKHHFCGKDIYHPDTEICCSGRRHPKKDMLHCCGMQTYDIKSGEMKCCAGTLYNLTLRDNPKERQCCGSVLYGEQDICCSDDEKKLLYSKRTGYRCCGHLYYNSSLWSCCAGTVNPVRQAGNNQSEIVKESTLLPLSKLNKTVLCNKLFIGTVESLSRHSIVFIRVLKIHGTNATVSPLPSPYLLNRSDHCSLPKLIPGVTYLFDEASVFTDFTPDSLPLWLHFMKLGCCYEVTTG